MAKRSDFKRRKNDLYRTPFSPVGVLAAHMPARFRYAEPCAANGKLVDHLRLIGGTCTEALDINPGRGDVVQGDACRWTPTVRLYRPLDFIITNPPWTRSILHRLIQSFSWIAPTWLLFDADWIHTAQSKPYQPYLRKIVTVGRVKWIEGSPHTGKDNSCWYLFDKKNPGPTEMIGR